MYLRMRFIEGLGVVCDRLVFWKTILFPLFVFLEANNYVLRRCRVLFPISSLFSEYYRPTAFERLASVTLFKN
jgi:hypothetical protein